MASSPDLIPSPPSPATILRGVAGFVRSTSINPHARPHPDLSPQNLIDLSLAALKNPTDPATRAALEHFLTPQATINHEPILNLESQLVPLAPKLKVVQIFSDEDVQLSPGPPEIRTSISTLIQPGRTNRYQITLTRASPHPWLIAAIDPDTS